MRFLRLIRFLVFLAGGASCLLTIVPANPAVAASVRPLKVISSTLFPRSDGSYTPVVLVKNRSRHRAAINVSGQFSLVSEDGELLDSINPNGINILPGSKGLFDGFIDVLDSHGSANPHLSVRLSVGSLLRAPRRSPVFFSSVAYGREPFGNDMGCDITGTVGNRFKHKHENLQLRFAVVANGQIVDSAFTYVDLVFPRVPAKFDATVGTSESCPERVDRVDVYPNLGEDKIFSP